MRSAWAACAIDLCQRICADDLNLESIRSAQLDRPGIDQQGMQGCVWCKAGQGVTSAGPRRLNIWAFLVCASRPAARSGRLVMKVRWKLTSGTLVDKCSRH